MGNDLEVARFCGGARVIVRRARVAGRILQSLTAVIGNWLDLIGEDLCGLTLSPKSQDLPTLGR